MPRLPIVLQHKAFLAHLDQMSWPSHWVWLATTVIGVGCEVLAGKIHPNSGKFWVYLALISSCGLYIWAMDHLRDSGGWVLGRLFFLGLTAGLLELLVDWALIHWVKNGRLSYIGLGGSKETVNDVVLLGSPIWMPLAWACLITNLGYTSLVAYKVARDRLRMPSRIAAILVSLAIGLVAGVSVGINESLASNAEWWTYEPAEYMVDNTPMCIPLGEFFQFLALFPIVAYSLTLHENRPVAGSLSGGLLFGGAIAGGYFLAYMLLEYGRTPGQGWHLFLFGRG